MAEDGPQDFAVGGLDCREVCTRRGHHVSLDLSTRFVMLSRAVSPEILRSLARPKTTLSMRHIPSFTPVSIVFFRPVDLPSRIRFWIAVLLTRISQASTSPP